MSAADELHECARCALMQRTCCQRAEVVVTAGDVARISAHTGRHGFTEHRRPADPAYVAFDPDDPRWVDYTVADDGTRHVLRRAPDGDCTFLGSSGCTLPESVRPLVCRLYPWSYTESGIDGVDSEYCPAQYTAGGALMTDLLGMDRGTAERWRSQLYAELRAQRPAAACGADGDAR